MNCTGTFNFSLFEELKTNACLLPSDLEKEFNECAQRWKKVRSKDWVVVFSDTSPSPLEQSTCLLIYHEPQKLCSIISQKIHKYSFKIFPFIHYILIFFCLCSSASLSLFPSLSRTCTHTHTHITEFSLPLKMQVKFLISVETLTKLSKPKEDLGRLQLRKGTLAIHV